MFFLRNTNTIQAAFHTPVCFVITTNNSSQWYWTVSRCLQLLVFIFFSVTLTSLLRKKAETASTYMWTDFHSAAFQHTTHSVWCSWAVWVSHTQWCTALWILRTPEIMVLMRATQQLSPSFKLKMCWRSGSCTSSTIFSASFFFLKHSVSLFQHFLQRSSLKVFWCLFFFFFTLIYKNWGLSFGDVKPTVCVNLTAWLLLLSADLLNNVPLSHCCSRK